jgi:hypothetical protein
MPKHKNIYKTDPHNEGQPFLLKEPLMKCLSSLMLFAHKYKYF